MLNHLAYTLKPRELNKCREKSMSKESPVNVGHLFASFSLHRDGVFFWGLQLRHIGEITKQ